MNYTVNDIIDFLSIQTLENSIRPDSDLSSDLGVNGDDFHELMTLYENTFKVDMTTYLWFFHTNDEGVNIGGYFFNPPNKKVIKISITPTMLTDFANKNKWDVDYPAHALPAHRYDIMSNQALTVLIIAVIILVFVFKLISS